MSEVTIIGLGNMGSALARAFVENKRTVTILNRSPEKAAALVELGAVLAKDAAQYGFTAGGPVCRGLGAAARGGVPRRKDHWQPQLDRHTQRASLAR